MSSHKDIILKAIPVQVHIQYIYHGSGRTAIDG